MSTATCPQCGASQPVDAAQGVCPRCALQFGLDTKSGEERAAFSDAGRSEALTESFHGGVRSTRRRTEFKFEDLPQPGDRFGSYQLKSVLGRGGMGMVYDAEDTATSRRVALKLLTHGWDSPESRNRFFREGRLAASINHPHSVYIYGTEEIDGTPVISMEHIAGGTLQDRVREHGPLPPAQAVDAILDIIAGLEAAAEVGVLHRDVKPSNCFLDAEGTVKIGDFGLSMSTTSHSDSYLTVPGAYLGTPAFSSPEQLRGDVLDVRSDIYAVGVTLFYLLTGRTPFEGENLVKLLATVLEQPAPSPARYQERLPRGLCRVVLRCLAKQAGDRYRDYTQLRAALVPFDSTAPTAASLALRFGAGACDVFVMSVVSTIAFTSWWRGTWTPGDVQLLGFTFGIVFNIFYFAVPEAIWGASIGKALMGLRVVTGQQGRLGFGRALARTLMYVGLPSAIGWVYWAVNGNDAMTPETTAGTVGMSLLAAMHWVILAAMFSTARCSNGFAAVHDLATGSRVVLADRRLERPRLAVEPVALPEKSLGHKVGPYHVLDSLREMPDDELLLGYDPRLLRRVWIHRGGPDAKPVSNHRRSVGRVGRLRWISGQRVGKDSWDAYDAFGGKSFLEVTQRPQRWEAVRAWLLDVATELTAAKKDNTMPAELRFDQIWITSEGRVKLLDFAAPRSAGGPSPKEADLPRETALKAGRFLKRMAVIGLHGGAPAGDEFELSDVAMRLPLSASESLARFEKSDLPDIVEELDKLSTGRPRISRLRRCGLYAAMAMFPLFAAGMSLFGLFALRTMAEIRPELNELRIVMLGRQTTHLDKNASPQEGKAREAAWEVYIANRFRATIEDKRAWDEMLARTIPQPDRRFAERAVQRHPNPTPQEVAAATAVVEPLIEPARKAQEQFISVWLRPQNLAGMAILQFALMWSFCVSFPTIVAALVARRGVIARALGIEYVTRKGRKASQFRLMWRAFLAQSVMAGLLVLGAFTMAYGIVVMWPLLLGFAVFALVLVLPLKTRSVADRLAGTYPVTA